MAASSTSSKSAHETGERSYTAEVICLRAYDFKEADRILHFFSPTHGRISAVVKGAKRLKSRLAGACEPLNLSEAHFARGKNLDILCQYQPRETFAGIRGDLLKLAYALLFAELLHQTVADMDSHAVFSDLLRTLRLLECSNDGWEPVTAAGIAFQAHLLEAAGFAPVLNACILTHQPLNAEALPETTHYCFSAKLGGVTHPRRKRDHQPETEGFDAGWVNVSASTLQILQFPASRPWQPEQWLKTQKFLAYYFRQVYEKPLRGYDLLLSLLEADLGNARLGGMP